MNVARRTRLQAGFSHGANVEHIRHERGSATATRSPGASVATGSYACRARGSVDWHLIYGKRAVHCRFAWANPCFDLVIATHLTRSLRKICQPASHPTPV